MIRSVECQVKSFFSLSAGTDDIMRSSPKQLQYITCSLPMVLAEVKDGAARLKVGRNADPPWGEGEVDIGAFLKP